MKQHAEYKNKHDKGNTSQRLHLYLCRILGHISENNINQNLNYRSVVLLLKQ